MENGSIVRNAPATQKNPCLYPLSDLIYWISVDVELFLMWERMSEIHLMRHA